MILQFCGLSGAGKSTLSGAVSSALRAKGLQVEVIDGDDYRKTISRGLGFSEEDRKENIRRLAFVASKFSEHGIIVFLSAINPYDDVRREIAAQYDNVKTVFIDCSMDELVKRDTKGLYKKAMLPEGHPDRVTNLTGVNDPFERPSMPDIVINTDKMSVDEASRMLTDYIVKHLPAHARKQTSKKESWRRSMIKAVSYRVFGTLATVLISFALTRQFTVALGIGAFDLISKVILYYLHERAWSKIPY